MPSSVFWSGTVMLQQAIQPLDDLLDAAAGLHVDERVARHVDEIADADDVVDTEVDDAVAVGARRDVHDEHGLVVELQLLLRARVGIVRPRVLARGATFPVGADIRSTTELNAITEARSFASASETRGSVEIRKRMVFPASAIFSLPPVKSSRSSVLTMYRMVPRGAIERTAASTLSLIAAVPVSTSSTPSSPADTVMLPPAPTSIDDAAAHRKDVHLAVVGGRDRRLPRPARAGHSGSARAAHQPAVRRPPAPRLTPDT